MRLLKELDYEEVAPRLKRRVCRRIRFLGGRGVCQSGDFSDVREWWRVVNGPVMPVMESPQLLETARELLPPAVGAVKAGAVGRILLNKQPAPRDGRCFIRCGWL
jgi:hypothetical protein